MVLPCEEDVLWGLRMPLYCHISGKQGLFQGVQMILVCFLSIMYKRKHILDFNKLSKNTQTTFVGLMFLNGLLAAGGTLAIVAVCECQHARQPID
jgi:hypothetical protein